MSGQVDRTPDSVVSEFEERALTPELEARSNRLARWLWRGKGVGPGVLVGVECWWACRLRAGWCLLCVGCVEGGRRVRACGS